MKNKRFLAAILCLAMLLGLIVLPSAAAETSQTDPTEAYVPETTPAISFGSESILQGCRTINGQVPLGGSERRLDSAQSVFVYDIDTDTVVYSYNPDAKMAPGTLSKFMTALVVIENCDLDETVVCSSRNISRLPGGSQNVKLKEKEELSVRDLLHCLILQSANDAAIALAEHVSGNMESFVTLMNTRAKEMGCNDTYFINVHGLDNSSQFTTARDIARMYNEAIKNSTFAELLSTTKYTVEATNKSDARKFECQNYLIDKTNITKYMDDRATGGLASHTNLAGSSLVCTAENKNLNLICVIMGAHREFDAKESWRVTYYGNFDEMIDLFQYLFNNFKSNRVLYEGQAFEQFPVISGECNVTVEPYNSFDCVLPADCQMTNIIKQYTYVDGALTAPIEEGDKIGTVALYYKNSCIGEAELYAMSDVKAVAQSAALPSQQTEENRKGSGLLSGVVTVCMVILIPTAAYLAINALRRANGRAKHRRRRANRRRSW